MAGPSITCVFLAALMGLATAGFFDTNCYVPKSSGGLGFCGPINVRPNDLKIVSIDSRSDIKIASRLALRVH